MKYHIYKVIQDNQEEYDIAVVNASTAYEYELYVDEDCRNHYIDTVECFTRVEIYDLSEVKEMNYYAELICGIVMFFKQEVNLYKWLYEHCGNKNYLHSFEVASYGKLKA